MNPGDIWIKVRKVESLFHENSLQNVVCKKSATLFQLGTEEGGSESGSEDEDEEDKPQVYRPPKLAAMHYGKKL